MDATSVALAWIAGAVLIVPLTGLTARFGLRPLVDAVARLRRAGSEDAVAEEMEERMAVLAAAVERLAEVVEKKC